MSGLADAISRALVDAGGGLLKGTVTQVAAPRVVVDLGRGGEPLTLSRLASYSPTVGDVVAIITSPDGWLVIGTIA